MENQNIKDKQEKYKEIMAAYKEKFHTHNEPGHFITQSTDDYYQMLLNAIKRGSPVTEDDYPDGDYMVE